MPATKLEGLGIDEVSGVDAPANSIPGWMVIKSEDGAVAAAESQLAGLYGSLGAAMVLEDAPDDVRKAAEELAGYIEKQLGAEDEAEPAPSLIDKMRSAFRSRKADAAAEAPAEKSEAAPEPKAEPAEKAEEITPEAATATPETAAPAITEDQVVKALSDGIETALAPIGQDIDALREVVSKVLDRIEHLEDYSVGSTQYAGQETQAPVAKAATLRDAILSAAAGNRVTIN